MPTSLFFTPLQTFLPKTNPEAQLCSHRLRCGNLKCPDQRKAQAQRIVWRGLWTMPYCSGGRRLLLSRGVLRRSRQVRLQFRNWNQGWSPYPFLSSISNLLVKNASNFDWHKLQWKTVDGFSFFFFFFLECLVLKLNLVKNGLNFDAYELDWGTHCGFYVKFVFG